VLTEKLAVIRRDHHERVLGEAALVEHIEHAPDRVIELRDHPVVPGCHHREVFTGERRASGIRPLHGPAAHSLRQDLVQRGLPLELVFVHDRQHLEHVGRRVAIAPRRGWIHRVVRVGEAHPPEERPVDAAQPLRRPIGDPRREVILLRQRVAPGLAVVPLGARGFGLHRGDPLVATLGAVAKQEPRIVQPERRRPEAPIPLAHQVGDTEVVPEHRELDVLEAEVRTVPIVGDARRALDRFDLARGQVRKRGREMRLAEEGRGVTGPTQQRRDRTVRGVGRQVDPVARDAVRRRVGAREDRRARGLAQRVLRARRREAGALRRERVETRCRAQRAAFHPERVGALLVGRDQEHIHGVEVLRLLSEPDEATFDGTKTKGGSRL
jgi:hypothetical protein